MFDESFIFFGRHEFGKVAIVWRTKEISFNVECNPGTVGTFLSKAEKDPDAARDHSEKLKTRDYYIGETFCPLVTCETGPN